MISLTDFFRDKEQEQADIDAEATIANTNLQKADSNLSHLKTQLNQKKMELKSGSSLTILSLSQANLLQTWNARSREGLITIRPWKRPLKRPPPSLTTEHRTFLSSCRNIILVLSLFYSLAGNMLGTSSIYESLLSVGRRRKVCGACNRHLTDQEFLVFEEHVGGKRDISISRS